MRCSSCEMLLDRYVEGTLSPRQMITVSQHLSSCESCRNLLQELKVVDGLLFTTRAPELPANFTFAVMAEVNALPAHAARQHPIWSFLALYSVAAWVASVLGIVLSRTSPQTLISVLSSNLSHIGSAVNALGASISRGWGHAAPSLAAFSLGLLVIDLAVAAAIVLLYFIVRPRLVARLASISEATP